MNNITGKSSSLTPEQNALSGGSHGAISTGQLASEHSQVVRVGSGISMGHNLNGQQQVAQQQGILQGVQQGAHVQIEGKQQSQQQQNQTMVTQQHQGSVSSPQRSDGGLEARSVAISRVEAQDVIVNFKRHLLDKWKKNKAKQHVNKIIHYHVQHTFFLRYAAPLFLKEYQELLNSNLAKEGGGGNNREQGLIATLKQINADILNGSKKTKSVDVLECYLTKLEQKDQLNTFLDVLVYILFGETPHQIPAELNERKRNLFHYVSPIIAFLIIFYIHADKKPLTLDELVTRSGLKQLYKNVRVPSKEINLDDPRGGNPNESEDDDDEDDEMIDEDADSILQNSQPQKLPPKPVAQTTQTLFKKKQNQVDNPIKEEEEDQTSNLDDKINSRSTTQFQDLEKTLLQQKQQHQKQQNQFINKQFSNDNLNTHKNIITSLSSYNTNKDQIERSQFDEMEQNELEPVENKQLVHKSDVNTFAVSSSQTILPLSQNFNPSSINTLNQGCSNNLNSLQPPNQGGSASQFKATKLSENIIQGNMSSGGVPRTQSTGNQMTSMLSRESSSGSHTDSSHSKLNPNKTFGGNPPPRILSSANPLQNQQLHRA